MLDGNIGRGKGVAATLERRYGRNPHSRIGVADAKVARQVHGVVENA